MTRGRPRDAPGSVPEKTASVHRVRSWARFRARPRARAHRAQRHPVCAPAAARHGAGARVGTRHSGGELVPRLTRLAPRGRLRISPQVGEGLADHRPLEDRRDDPLRSATGSRAAPQVDIEDALEQPRPANALRPHRLRLERPALGVRRDLGGPLHERQRAHHPMRRPVSPWCLQLQLHLPCRVDLDALVRQRGPGDIAAGRGACARRPSPALTTSRSSGRSRIRPRRRCVGCSRRCAARRPAERRGPRPRAPRPCGIRSRRRARQGTSLPGFMIPSGSSACLIRRIICSSTGDL